MPPAKGTHFHISLIKNNDLYTHTYLYANINKLACKQYKCHRAIPIFMAMMRQNICTPGKKKLKDLCVMCDCQSKVVWQWLATRHSSNGQALGPKI